MSVCAACDRKPPRSGGISSYLAKALGARWWAVEDIGESCAEVITALLRDGICDRHAAWLATLARLRILGEARRRALVPGMTLLIYGEISEDPHEPLSTKNSASAADVIALGVQRFVAGSPLAALVEIDLEHRRARVTLQVAGSDPLQTMAVEFRRLSSLTPGDVLDGLRQRVAAG